MLLISNTLFQANSRLAKTASLRRHYLPQHAIYKIIRGQDIFKILAFTVVIDITVAKGRTSHASKRLRTTAHRQRKKVTRMIITRYCLANYIADFRDLFSDFAIYTAIWRPIAIHAVAASRF